MLLRHAGLLAVLLLSPSLTQQDLKAQAGGGLAAAPATAPAAPTAGLPAREPAVPTSPPLATTDLPERFKRWLREVDPLITRMEREAFLGLRQDYHRDAFIRKFWQVRDPYPETGRNELKENWDERVFQAESEFDTLDDDRARILLVHGPPDATMEVRCTTTRTPVTVWLYDSSEVVDFRFLLVFVRAGSARAAPRSGARGRVRSRA